MHFTTKNNTYKTGGRYKMVKKITALLLSTIMMVSVTACSNTSDTQWIAKTQDTTLQSGYYILSLANHMMNLMMETGTFDSKELLATQTDGIKTQESVELEAMKRVKEYFSINQKINELGYTLSPEEQARVDSTIESAKSLQEFYVENGISDESVKEYYTTQHKKTLLFKNYYNAQTGVEPVTNEQLKAHGVEKYIRTKYILFSKEDQKGEPIADEQALAQLKEKAQSYLKRLEKGEKFEPLLHELELEAQHNAQNGFVLEYPGERPEPPQEVETAPFEPEKVTTDNGYTHTHADGEAHTIKEGEYDVIAEKTDTSDPVKTSFIALVKDLPVGQITLVEDETAFYVVQNIEFDEAFVDQLSLNFLFDMKADEFDNLLQVWADEMQLTINENAKKAYSSKKIKF